MIIINRFWNFKEPKNNEIKEIKNKENKGSKENKERELHLEGPIADETWWGDEITPKEFKSELNSGKGNITVFIDSPGGDVFAASEIYTALKEYSKKSGKVTVKISSLAASAASIVAMAGDKVLMSPAAYLMIHNPWTITAGNSEEMRLTARQLDEIKEGVINSYQIKTGLSRDEISKLMNEETYINARKAVELGFADEILYEKENEREYEKEVLYKRNGEECEKDEYEKEEYEKDKKENKPREVSVAFSQKLMANQVLAKIREKPLKQELKEKEEKEELKRKPLDEEAKRQEGKEELKEKEEKEKSKEKEGKKNMKKKDEDEKEAAKTKLDYRKYHEILNKLKI